MYYKIFYSHKELLKIILHNSDICALSITFKTDFNTNNGNHSTHPPQEWPEFSQQQAKVTRGSNRCDALLGKRKEACLFVPLVCPTYLSHLFVRTSRATAPLYD